MLGRFVTNYIQRHQHPANQVLHLIGVPVTFGLSIAFLIRAQYAWAAVCFVGGYLLQFLGHAIEGNDAGEVVLIKKLLGKPYQEFAPSREASPATESKIDG